MVGITFVGQQTPNNHGRIHYKKIMSFQIKCIYLLTNLSKSLVLKVFTNNILFHQCKYNSQRMIVIPIIFMMTTHRVSASRPINSIRTIVCWSIVNWIAPCSCIKWKLVIQFYSYTVDRYIIPLTIVTLLSQDLNK